MACTFGRITSLQSPDTIRRDGDQLTLGGAFEISSSVNGQVLADQLLGYGLHNVDEPVIPFTYDASLAGNALDGFYFVAKTTVNYTKLAAGLFSWTAELVKVAGSQSPLIEIVTSGADRVGEWGTPASWVAIPNTAVAIQFSDNASSLTGTFATHYGENGDTRLFPHATFLYANSVVFALALADYYDDAAGILAGTRVASSTAPVVTGHKPVVGRQYAGSLTGWMLTNGIMRVLPGPNAGEILVGQWEDSAAVTAGANAWTYKSYRFTVAGGTATTLGDPDTFTILYNRPELVTARIWVGGTSPSAAMYVDLTLRRGATWVEGTMADPTGSRAPGVFRFTNEAGTAVAGGLTATSDDAATNKYTLRSPDTPSTETTKGGIHTTGNALFPFAISTDRFSGAEVTIDEGYLAAMQHLQTVSAR